jgi:hypothetical protein
LDGGNKEAPHAHLTGFQKPTHKTTCADLFDYTIRTRQKVRR